MIPPVETTKPTFHQQLDMSQDLSRSSQDTVRSTYSTYVVRVHTRHGIKTISFDLLASFFTYTAKKAAEDLGISSRTLIRVCRSLGIRRWPYLGFRSEKNVERIRQDAMDNLRRKLERESVVPTSSSPPSLSTTPAITPTSACIRGASAKRLLQVNLPQMSLPPTVTNLITPVSFPAQIRNCQHMYPLLTPPPTNNTFDLSRGPSISPRRLPSLHMTPIAPAYYDKEKLHSAIPRLSVPTYTPSLNILANASILTTFKQNMKRAIPSPSASLSTTMSMRDVLAATAT